MNFQSLCKGALASVLFMLLAVSVSENAAAQVTVQLCDGDITGNVIDDDPHSATGGLSSLRNSCRETGDFSGNAYIATDPSSQVCGACIETTHLTGGELSIGDCNVDASWVKYQIPSTNKFYCGPISQCVAAGGTRGNANDNAPTCANECATAGERLFNNNTPEILGDDFCAAPATCTGLLVPNDFTNECECQSPNEVVGGNCVQACDTGETRKNGVCVAISTLCEVGATGQPATDPDDRVDPHNTGISNNDACHPDAPGVSPEQRLSLYIFTDQDFAECRNCNVRGGINFEGREACDLPNIIYTFNNFRFCGPSDQCTAVSGTVENGDCSGCSDGFDRVNGRCVPECSETHERNSDEECAARAASDCPDDHEFMAESANPADGGVCEQCETYESSTGGAECLTAAAADCPDNFEFGATSGTSGTCTACLTNEVSAGGNACECNAPHYDATAECRLPAENSECASVYTDGSAPIFDEEEPTNCRALEGEDCPTGEVLLTGASACSACTAPRTPNADRNACECADPNVEVGGECRLPAGNAECAGVGDGSTPIFDETEPTNCRVPEAGSECPTGQVFENGACSACTGLLTPNTARDACECADPNVEVNGECQEDVSVSCTDAHHRLVDNVCTECDTDQHLVNGACVACDPNEVRVQGAAACTCPHYDNTDAGTCDLIPDCTDAHHRLVDNVCTECEADMHLVNGECVACDANEVRAQEAAACTCPVFTDTDGSCIPFTDCADPLDLNEADNTCFCNSETHFEETDGSCVAHADCTDAGDNVIRNTQDNTCVCADNSEGTPETACTACTGGKTSQGGADCACPADTLPFENSEGVCEASLDGTCTEPRDFYNPVTNMCECPTGQRLNADETACEAIPASSDGGSSNGAVIALVAVPAVLIGGYWLLGGFDYIDPAYGLDYSGENGDIRYTTQGGFDLNHGDLSSYVRAIQSNGDAVAYESGISYGKDIYSLNYAAYESQSEYAYDLSANLNYGSGLWSISPTADAEFHYNADSEDWTSEAGAGLTAAWTSHKWNVRAHSAFAGDLNHGLDVEFRF